MNTKQNNSGKHYNHVCKKLRRIETMNRLFLLGKDENRRLISGDLLSSDRVGLKGNFKIIGNSRSGKTTLLKEIIEETIYSSYVKKIKMYSLKNSFSTLIKTKDFDLKHINISLENNYSEETIIESLENILNDIKNIVKNAESLEISKSNNKENLTLLFFDDFGDLKENNKIVELVENISNIGISAGIVLIVAADNEESIPAKISGNLGNLIKKTSPQEGFLKNNAGTFKFKSL